MIKNKRQEEIIEILKNEGFASVRGLSERLYASQATVRRDLEFLEREGFIQRNHGGAILAGERINIPISFRQKKRYHEKLKIAELAATLIERDSLVFADASTTVLCLADRISEIEGITVVTNGLLMAQSLVKSGVEIFATGGKLNESALALVGRIAERSVAGFNADIMFFSTSSFDGSGQISDYSDSETSLRIAMLERSRKKVFMFDSSKYSTESAFCVCYAKDIDHIVTDVCLGEDVLDKIGYHLDRSKQRAYLYSNNRK